VNARNRVFLILGLLTVGSLIWYFVTVRPTTDLQLIGTVDANEVVVSSKIPGRIQTLTVDEGQQVKAGQLIAIIESDDLQAARKAAEATAASQKGKLGESVETERQTRGETGSATVNAEAMAQAPPRPRWPRRRPTTTISRPTPAAPSRWPAGHHERAGQGRRGHQPPG
jgi:HlyD family secretion protein